MATTGLPNRLRTIASRHDMPNLKSPVALICGSCNDGQPRRLGQMAFAPDEI